MARSETLWDDALVNATHTCTAAYNKGKKSFEIVAILNPETLHQHLPSFVRCERILDEHLK